MIVVAHRHDPYAIGCRPKYEEVVATLGIRGLKEIIA